MGKKKEMNFEDRWNEIFEKLIAVRNEWRMLQEDLNGLSGQELEQEYSIAAQRMLTKFRNVRFDLVVPMWVDYWRGWGGVESMLIEVETVEKAKKVKKVVKEEKSSVDRMVEVMMEGASTIK